MTPASDPKVVLAYCAGEQHATLFGICKDRLLLADRQRGRIIDVLGQVSSPRIAPTRNSLVDAFLRHPASPDYLLMLDADIVFDPDLVERLLEAAHPTLRPIVSGVYFGGRHHGEQHAHIYKLNETGDGFYPVSGLKDGWGAVVQIEAAGAGCLLMHRSALQAIGDRFTATGYPWFVEGAGAQGAEYGEDIAFCLRAYSLSIPMFAHTGVRLGHLKLGVLDEFTHEEYRAKEEMFGVDEVRRQANERMKVAVDERPVDAQEASAP